MQAVKKQKIDQPTTSDAHGADVAQTTRPVHRLALVIGNANYPRAFIQLPACKNDADQMGAKLVSLGYELSGGKVWHDLNAKELDEKLHSFACDVIQSKDTHAILYFSGHGCTIKGNREPGLYGSDGIVAELRPLLYIYDRKIRPSEEDYLCIILDGGNSGDLAASLVPLKNMFIMFPGAPFKTSPAAADEDTSIFTQYLLLACQKDKDVIQIFRSAVASMPRAGRFPPSYRECLISSPCSL